MRADAELEKTASAQMESRRIYVRADAELEWRHNLYEDF